MNITLTSELARFVQQRVKDGLYGNASEVVRDALRVLKRSYETSLDRLIAATGIGSMDVSEVALIVMMQATKDMDEDLEMIMAEMKGTAAAKQRLRELIKELNAWISSEMEKLDHDASLESTREELVGKLDGTIGLLEMGSLRLQMAMDRRSKFISTLSNIMKKVSTTQEAIVQNLK
jgi:putative addiction module CopG family antidote